MYGKLYICVKENLMDTLIKLIYDNGLTDIVYYSFHALSLISVILWNMWYGPKYGISKKKSIIITVFVFPLTYLWMDVLTWVENQFSNWGAQNIVRVFIYVPIFCIIIAKILHLDNRKVLDCISFSPCIVQAVSHWGCAFAGCCRGYKSSFGIYNPIMRCTLFPIQIVESLTAAVIVVVLVWMSKKDNYDSRGTLFPKMLVMFGFTRFFLEYLRDNKKIIGGISVLALHAALMFAVGCIWLIVAYKKRKKEEKKALKKSMKKKKKKH